MSSMLTTLPSSARKATESGISVFFIQKHCFDGRSKTNSMPSPAGIDVRNINPISRCSGVAATSALMLWMPALRRICASRCGPSCAAASAATQSEARATAQRGHLSFTMHHPT